MSNIAIKGAATGGGTFTLEAPATSTNRTLTLPDEAGTVLTSVSSITSSQLTGDAVPLGVGQTWQNVTGSRVKSTTYYNTTGKPIALSLVSTAGNAMTLTINGVLIFSGNSGGVDSSYCAAIVPDTQSYLVTASASVTQWLELR